MSEDLEARIKALEEKLTPSPEKMSTMKATNRLKQYLDSLKIGTQEEAVWWLIEQAEKVPIMEKDISKLEEGIIKLSYECGDLKIENEQLEARIKELEGESKC